MFLHQLHLESHVLVCAATSSACMAVAPTTRVCTVVYSIQTSDQMDTRQTPCAKVSMLFTLWNDELRPLRIHVSCF